MTRRHAWLIGLAIALPGQTTAYEIPTHEVLSRSAVEQSSLSVGDALATVGLKELSVYSSQQSFPSSEGKEQTISDLVAFGANWEDSRAKVQALRHFYNPVNGRPLTFDPAVPLVSAWIERSPDWSLEDVDAEGYGDAQPFSYKKARQYLFEAVTARTLVQRRQNWGLTFQTIGHVIHHLQDMAQPQHVRNDSHCDSGWCRAGATMMGNPALFHPSRYEKWTLDEPPADQLFASYDPVYSQSAAGVFRRPRAFWTTTNPTGAGANGNLGSGIAEYTSRGFFSAATIDAAPEHPFPLMGDYSQEFLGTLCREAVSRGRPLCPDGVTDIDVMRFRATNVTDQLRPALGGTNQRGISRSIYDEDLERAGSLPIYALNRFNFDAAHEYLIPRAVGYSAGLINFFFRGKLEISLPDEGIYAAVDHHTAAGSTLDTGGFDKIRLKLRNLTPAGTDSNGNLLTEPMPAGVGSLVAVVKFHRNTCYRPDLSREYGSRALDGTPLVDWAQCRSSEEDIVVSDPLPTPAGLNEAPQPLTFHFPDRIPINATDVFLQVVYRGPLGEESDAVVVTTRDISETSYVYSLPERYDQFTRAAYPSFEPGPYGWEEWCAQGGMTLEQCNDDYGNRRKWRFTPNEYYDPANYNGESRPVAEEAPFDPVLAAPAHVGKYGRAAVLTDLERPEGSPYPLITGPYYLYLRLSESGITNPETFNWNWGGFRVTENQLDPATGTLTPSVTYQQARGVFLYSGDHSHFLQGDAPNVPPLQPVPTTINFPD